MSEAERRYVFGPVPSRRLGRSLGLDLVPFKTCSYDCVYCQLGPTTCKTVQRREYVPLADVLRELARVLQEGPAPDVVTLAGSGEPTLFEPLGELIRDIKRLTSLPVVVLTNGSLLHLPEVREQVATADLVIPSLDAGDDEHFQLVNRPHPDIRFADMVAGLREFRRVFHGELWLEILLLADCTAQSDHVRKIARLVEDINPDRIQLNSVARPPAEPWARAATPAEMAAAAGILGARAEVVTDYAAAGQTDATAGREGEVLGLLQRRPCRLDDLAAGLGIHRNELVKYLEHLLKAGSIITTAAGSETWYQPARPAQPSITDE